MIKLASYISKICAEEISPRILSKQPEEVTQKIQTHFNTRTNDNNKIAAFRKTLFPEHHYLEFQKKDSHIEYKLRVRKIDTVLVTLAVISGTLFSLTGLAFTLHGLFSAPPIYRQVSGGLLFICAGAGLIIFIYMLYRFFRWGAGLSNPEKLLHKYGIN